jgi:hypothetical protein
VRQSLLADTADLTYPLQSQRIEERESRIKKDESVEVRLLIAEYLELVGCVGKVDMRCESWRSAAEPIAAERAAR